MKIIGLRIHLDDIYNADTTDIWFSSNAKYNGTKANNNIMILKPKNLQIQSLNSKKDNKDIIIATEMLLAYKLHKEYKENIIIGIPNVLTKNEIQKLYDKEEINKIFLVMEQHTILHSSKALLKNLINNYGEDKIILKTMINNNHNSSNVSKLFNDNEKLMKYSA